MRAVKNFAYNAVFYSMFGAIGALTWIGYEAASSAPCGQGRLSETHYHIDRGGRNYECHSVVDGVHINIMRQKGGYPFTVRLKQ